MTDRIDLRSDTVTLPSAAMRRAMAEAPVGDDQYGEDPTTNRLQERVAALLGKEAGLFVASGTLANQLALKLFTRPGDDVVVSEESHAVWHETGAGAANNGVQFTIAGRGGTFTADDFLAAYKAPGHVIYPPTTLVEIENTHNRGGGVVFPQADAEAVCAAARKIGVASYLDGARLFNAAAASGKAAAQLAAPFDLAAIALSKGLGCPVGTVLAGRKDDIARAVRYRRMLGGAMRQSGILAAAGLYALESNVARLAEDHANARLIAERLAQSSRVNLDMATVQTNILVFRVTDAAPDGATVVARARERGVLLSAFGPRMLRLVTHLDVSREQCATAAAVVAAAIDAR
jgi:threonine aldolase